MQGHPLPEIGEVSGKQIMAIRKGSLDGLVEQVGDLELLELALSDYEMSARREHCSRKDYVAGYVALARRLRARDTLALGVVFQKTHKKIRPDCDLTAVA
jgi:hypothetical protein